MANQTFMGLFRYLKAICMSPILQIPSPSSLFHAQHLQFLQLFSIVGWPYVCPSFPGIFCVQVCHPNVSNSSPLNSHLSFNSRLNDKNHVFKLHHQSWSLSCNEFISLCLQPGSCYSEIAVCEILLLLQVEKSRKDAEPLFVICIDEIFSWDQCNPLCNSPI